MFNVQPTKPRSEFTSVDITAQYIYDDDTDEPLPMEDASPWNGPYPNENEQHHPFGEGWDIWEANTLDEVPRPCRVAATLVDPPSAVRYDCFETASNGGEPGLHPAWLAFIRHCQELGFGEISQLKIQDGVPVMAEETIRKVKFV